jgi:outer membrane receptor for ferrienterochelin and colicins
MGQKFIYIFSLIMIFAASMQSGLSYAQNCDELINIPEAEKKYATGNFDEVIELLSPCIEKGFSKNAQAQAYKLLAMTYLALDSERQAAISIQNLITINPYFDPEFTATPQFKELFKRVKDSQETIIQITSVSKRAENIQKVPATVVVITDKDIAKRGYQNLEQVLHDLSGIDMAKGNGPGYSNFYVRGYRSTSNDRMLMLIDGVEENDLASDNVPISRQYTLSDIERIEIVYGPASTMYGNNAFVGVINIITKKYREVIDGNNKLLVKGQAKLGSWESKFIDATIAGKTKDVAISITGRVFQCNEMSLEKYPEWNFDPRISSDYTNRLDLTGANAQSYIDKTKLTTKYPNSDLFNVDYNNNNVATAIKLTPKGEQRAAELDNVLFNGNAYGEKVKYSDVSKNYYIKAKVEFKDFYLTFTNWQTNEGATPWYTNQVRLSSNDLSRWVTSYRSFATSYNKILSEKFQIINISSYRLHEINANTNLATYKGYFNNKLSFLDLANGIQPSYSTTNYYRVSNQFRTEIRLLWSPLPKLDINSGIEYRNSIIQGNYITSGTATPEESGLPTDVSFLGGNNFRVYDLGTYSQSTYRYSENLNLVAGFRIDHNKVRKNGGYGAVFNPRLSAVYSKGNITFKAIYAEAFKDASYLQKYGTTADRQLNNPTLQPEKVKNLEFSLNYKISKKAGFSISTYRANYSNSVGLASVVLENGTTTNQFQGIGQQRIWGVQAEANYQSEQLTVWSNFTFTNPLDLLLDLRISDIAKFSFNVGANYQLTKKIAINATTHYVGARKTGAGTSGSKNPILLFAPYFVMNSAISYHEILKGISLQASINNLFNKEYFDPGIRDADGVGSASRFPQERRNISVGVIFDIK